MYKNLTKPTRCGFADLLSNKKTIKKFKKATPPDWLISGIKDISNKIIKQQTQNNLYLVEIDTKTKNKMAQASEAMYKRLSNNSDNPIDIAKLNALSNYSLFFIKAPTVFAVIQNTNSSTSTTSLINIIEEVAFLKSQNLEFHEISTQLIAQKEFSQILHLKDNQTVLTLIAAGYPQE